jgi:sensor c-di-GMP phosphodiesterase-like protein
MLFSCGIKKSSQHIIISVIMFEGGKQVRSAVKIRLYVFVALALIFGVLSLLVMWLYGIVEDDVKRHRAQFVYNIACEGCERNSNASSDEI